MATARRSYQTDRKRAIAVQCLARKRSAWAEFRRRKKERDDVEALQAKIRAFEVKGGACEGQSSPVRPGIDLALAACSARCYCHPSSIA